MYSQNITVVGSQYSVCRRSLELVNKAIIFTVMSNQVYLLKVFKQHNKRYGEMFTKKSTNFKIIYSLNKNSYNGHHL